MIVFHFYSLDPVCGYIFVAPVMTNKFTTAQYESVRTPVMIVVGQKDTSLGQTAVKHLSQIPGATKPQVFPNGRHPCYLDDPKRWHRLLYNFERRLDCTY